MKHLPRLLALCFSLALALTASAVTEPGVHPRLLFGPEDVPALRAKVKQAPFSAMLARMREIADADPDITGKPSILGQHSNMIANRHAFLYVFTGDNAYAASARKHVEAVIDADNWAKPNVKGLTLYNTGAYVAFAYDLCHGSPAWDAAFSTRVAKALRAQYDVIFNNGGTEQNTDPASNWMGLRWSSAALIQLVLADPTIPESNLQRAHQGVERFLTESMGSHPAARGWGIEGLGYTYYPMGNGVAQYVLAAKRHSAELDLTTHPALRMSLWTIYAGLLPSSRGLFRPDFGDDNPNARGEGCYGFAFATCPPELLPGLKYWYDRTVGALGNKTYDDARFGVAASILYYPADLEARDPMTIPEWREAFADTAGVGLQMWRGRYRDAGDVVVQLYAKLLGDRGHHGPDALSFRIAGMDTLWATGGGRYQNWGAIRAGVEDRANGKNIYRRSMNTLYPVDPDDTLRLNGNRGRILGEPHVASDGSGWSVLRIDQNNVGTRDHVRRFITDFQADAEAAVIIADTSEDGRFWQLATLGDNTITTRDNTFTITSPAGDTMRGTVLHPAKPVFKTGKRARGSLALGQKDNAYVHFGSPDGDYLVVLTLARKGQAHPPVFVKGTWSGTPDGMVRVGPVIYAIQGETITRQER